MKRTNILMTLCAAAALALPTGVQAKNNNGNGHGAAHAAADCPPGLAKKNPPCVPPGLAKKHTDDQVRYDDGRDDGYEDGYRDGYADGVYDYRAGDRISGDYVVVRDPARYGLDPAATYYRVGDGIYQVDRETQQILTVVGLASQLLN